MESNFTMEQIAARDDIIGKIAQLDGYQICKVEGIILGMIAAKEG